MKFSILLPTRDRLDLLKLAVDSVLSQSYQNFEIVISDNNSKDDVTSFVHRLNDNRVVLTSFDHSVSVTDNWNNALNHSIGDYIIMLGDDDALMPNYFEEMLKVIQEFKQPDCIYTASYMFTYKGVIPKVNYGQVVENRNSIFFNNRQQSFLLEKNIRLKLVNDSMNFYSSFGFNMQYVTMKRSVVNLLSSGQGFYKTQYPDYYAMNNLMLNVESFVVVEKPLVAIGTSKSSFGWYYHNMDEFTGNKVLNIELGMEQAAKQTESLLLSGTSMNTNWLTSMLKLYEDNSQVGLAMPNINRYRLKQIIYYVLLMANKRKPWSEFFNYRRQLTTKEKFYFICLIPLLFLGGSGRLFLAKLHTLSQKRFKYSMNLLLRKLSGNYKIINFDDDSNILDITKILSENE